METFFLVFFILNCLVLVEKHDNIHKVITQIFNEFRIINNRETITLSNILLAENVSSLNDRIG